jgi:enoyl-CoA hydratase/carnithine racemase
VTTSTDKDGICEVVLNRPDKLNACDMKMFQSIAEAASQLRDDRSVRAVIVRGEGRAFCTGLDVKSVMGSPLQQIETLLKRPSGYGKPNNEVGNLAQDVSYLWRELPVPVICVLHGMCYGAGLQIALGADFRYATPDCKLSVMETKWGLIPDMSISITLRELVRIDVAKDLTMTGRVVLGTEAAELGLVSKVCEDPLKDAHAFAKVLVERSPDALASAKELYQSTWTAASEKECLELETKLQRKLLVSWNQLASSGRAFGYDVPFLNRKGD